MKILTLMVSLLSSLHAFANSCDASGHTIVYYSVKNNSEYDIHLVFDKPVHGENPESEIYAHYANPVTTRATGRGCSIGYVTGYETRATLRASKGESYFDLAYLYIKDPFYFDGKFSYKAYSIKMPECSCGLLILSDDKPTYYDCSSYTGPLGRHVSIIISCK